MSGQIYNTGFAVPTAVTLVGSAVTWADATAARLDTQDGSDSTSVLASGNKSRILRPTGYGFSVPDRAKVVGIQLRIWRRLVTGTDIRDFAIRLASGGANYGDDQANTVDNWPGTVAAADYGGESDLWGESITPAIVNDADFGASIRAQSTIGGTAGVDQVQVKAFYTLPAIVSEIANEAAQGLRRVAWSISCNGDGMAEAVLPVSGKLYGLATVPDLGYPPAASFDVTILDQTGADVTGGAIDDRSNSVAQMTHPYIAEVDGHSLYPVQAGDRLQVSNAGEDGRLVLVAYVLER